MDFQTLVFFFLSAILIFAALRVITASNPVHAALHLILAFFTCGGIWALLQAEFLAIAIILVYVGAVMVLFLFVVMVMEMGLVLGSKYFQVPAAAAMVPAGVSNTRNIAVLMYTDFVFPVELASIILLVGMIAAIVLTYRGPKQSKYTNPNQQVFVKAKDRVRVLQMPVEKD